MANNNAMVLMYHNIGKPPLGSTLPKLYVSPWNFASQMAYLHYAGYQVVSLERIVEQLKGDKAGKNAISTKQVAITFDDGYLDFYQCAYPVLKKYKMTATVFLVPNCVGTTNQWDEGRLKVSKPLMNWDQIKELDRSGIEFGAHTLNHAFLGEIPPDEMEKEIIDSKVVLEKQLNHPVRYFCYPYGNYNRSVREVVEKAGYMAAVTTRRGFVRPGDNPYELKRIFVKDSIPGFLFQLYSHYEDRKGGGYK